jgi:hypothetical protein
MLAVAHRRHHLLFQARVQPRGRFVPKKEAGVGKQFRCNRDALALPATQCLNKLACVRGHLHLVEHGRHTLVKFGGSGIGQAQAGGITQRAPDGEMAVDDVILRHVTQDAATSTVGTVEVIAVDEHLPLHRR